MQVRFLLGSPAFASRRLPTVALPLCKLFIAHGRGYGRRAAERRRASKATIEFSDSGATIRLASLAHGPQPRPRAILVMCELNDPERSYSEFEDPIINSNKMGESGHIDMHYVLIYINIMAIHPKVTELLQSAGIERSELTPEESIPPGTDDPHYWFSE